ncbi:MAG: ABC transporter permease [Geminicoccaceae bacterium]|nr:ABC transporter permease [Geminicoccaceae bacterium]
MMTPAAAEATTPSTARSALRAIRRAGPMLLSGGTVLALVVLASLFVPLLVEIDPLGIDVAQKLLPPSAEHWLGTDEFGREVLDRLIIGAHISLRVAFAATLLTAVLGIALGALSGQYRLADSIIGRFSDALLVFPGFVLAIMILAALGPSELNVVLAVVVLYVPRVIRTVRASIIEFRSADFVQAARAVGVGDMRLLVVHILPKSFGPVMVQLTFGFAWAILVEAGLSFLGLGPPPPSPSWGNMISAAREFIRTAPWIMIAPGVMITITVLSLNLIGDGLRDLVDPRLQGKVGP